MKYAVVRVKGTQYRVTEGEEILIDRLKEGEKMSLEVLLFVDGENFELGTPSLVKIKVKTKLLGEEMGKKIHVLKFRSKSRYRKKIGSRPKFSRIEIEKISTSK